MNQKEREYRQAHFIEPGLPLTNTGQDTSKEENQANLLDEWTCKNSQ